MICPHCHKETVKNPALNIAFIITMPNVGSWNGRFSGANKLFCVIKKITAAKEKTRAQSLIGQDFYYNFGDGWGANVEVRQVSAEEAKKMKKAKLKKLLKRLLQRKPNNAIL